MRRSLQFRRRRRLSGHTINMHEPCMVPLTTCDNSGQSTSRVAVKPDTDRILDPHPLFILRHPSFTQPQFTTLSSWNRLRMDASQENHRTGNHICQKNAANEKHLDFRSFLPHDTTCCRSFGVFDRCKEGQETIFSSAPVAPFSPGPARSLGISCIYVFTSHFFLRTRSPRRTLFFHPLEKGLATA